MMISGCTEFPSRSTMPPRGTGTVDFHVGIYAVARTSATRRPRGVGYTDLIASMGLALSARAVPNVDVHSRHGIGYCLRRDGNDHHHGAPQRNSPDCDYPRRGLTSPCGIARGVASSPRPLSWRFFSPRPSPILIPCRMRPRFSSRVAHHSPCASCIVHPALAGSSTLERWCALPKPISPERTSPSPP